jgi:hypothetical protein
MSGEDLSRIFLLVQAAGAIALIAGAIVLLFVWIIGIQG